MQVTILNTSHDSPLSFIGRVAGISHGRDDESVKRALGCPGRAVTVQYLADLVEPDGGNDETE